MNKYSSIAVIICLSVKLYCQCPNSIYFCSQADVDSFPIKYDGCISFDTIIIDDDCSTIKDLSPLLGIKNVNRLELLALFELESLFGLDSIRELKKLYYSGNPKIIKGEYFKSLAKIDNLEHYFHGENQDLTIYKNVKHINKMSFIYNGKLIGMDNLERNSNLDITIRENKIENNFNQLIPKDQDSIKVLFVSFCENLSTMGLEKIKYIDQFDIGYLDNSNFTHFDSLIKINILAFVNLGQNMFFSKSFQNIKTIESFYFSENKYIDSIRIVLPQLKSIKNLLVLDNNNILNINQFSNFELPNRSNASVPNPLYQPYNIFISNNKNLTACHNDFICEALTTYPDSVNIYNNGTGCSKEELFEKCTTSTSESIYEVIPTIWPNPFSESLKVNQYFQKYEIYNSQGKQVQFGVIEGQEINTNNLEVGLYFLKLIDGNKSVQKKIIKVE
jgi:hypothetical protein